tara:strand:- start:297 stop:425 length:129 start_codon:yes stop_codon:yes gene_type:complete
MKCDICKLNMAAGGIQMHCFPKGKVCFGCVKELVERELKNNV